MAHKKTEALQLMLSDLNRMKQEFLEVYEKLFQDSLPRLRRAIMLKLRAMKICDKNEKKMCCSRFDIRKQEPDQSVQGSTYMKSKTTLSNAYPIEAIELNKIDEASIEDDSVSQSSSPDCSSAVEDSSHDHENHSIPQEFGSNQDQRSPTAPREQELDDDIESINDLSNASEIHKDNHSEAPKHKGEIRI